MVLVHKRRARLPLPVYLLSQTESFRCLSAWAVLAHRAAELQHIALAEAEPELPGLGPELSPGEILEEFLAAAMEGDTVPDLDLFGDPISPDRNRQMFWQTIRELGEAITLQMKADAYTPDRKSGKEVGPGDPLGAAGLRIGTRFCAPTFVTFAESTLAVEVVRSGRLDGRATRSVPPNEASGRPYPSIAQTVRVDVEGSVESHFLSLFRDGDSLSDRTPR